MACVRLPIREGIPVNNTTYKSIDIHEPQLATPSYQKDPVHISQRDHRIEQLKQVVTQATERGLLQNLVNAASNQQEILAAPWPEAPHEALKRESHANSILEIQAASSAAKNQFEKTDQSQKEADMAMQRLVDKFKKVEKPENVGDLNEFVKDELLESENISPKSMLQQAARDPGIPLMAKVPHTGASKVTKESAPHYLRIVEYLQKQFDEEVVNKLFSKQLTSQQLDDVYMHLERIYRREREEGTPPRILEEAMEFVINMIDENEAEALGATSTLAEVIPTKQRPPPLPKPLASRSSAPQPISGEQLSQAKSSLKSAVAEKTAAQEAEQVREHEGTQDYLKEIERSYGKGTSPCPKKTKKGGDYCIDDKGRFGECRVDMDHFGRGVLKAYKGKKVIAHKTLSPGLEHLLTKRFDRRTDYTKDDMDTFSYLAKHGKVIPPITTMKGKLVRGKIQGREASGEGFKKKEVIKPIYYSDPKELVDRLHILLGSIDAGNTNDNLKSEASQLIDVLKGHGLLSESQAHTMYDSLML